MSGSIQAISSSLETLNEQYRTITHNLANASTAGFKRQIGSTMQSLAGQLLGASESTGPSVEEVTGTVSIDFTPGAMVRTGRPLDLALQGKKGFFVIDTPEGPLYTRNGVFQVNAQRQLVDSAGRTVSGEGGPIVIPSSVAVGGVSVATDGSVSAAGQSIGQFKLVEFDEPTQLIQVGSNCFRAPQTLAPVSATEATVHQGFQEASNVRVVEELVDLIAVTRLYEANLKSISAQDERMRNILNVAMG